MIADAMASRLLAGAGGTASRLAGAARHLAWYVSYQVDLHGAARVDGIRRDGRVKRRPGGGGRP